MKDNVTSLFRDRFQGHESGVDPGLWTGIQAQMAASAPAADGVNELFKERFEGHGMEVDPSAWQAISSQLGHTAGIGTTSTMLGWVAAGAVVVVAGVAGFLFLDQEKAANEMAIQPIIEVVRAAPTAPITVAEEANVTVIPFTAPIERKSKPTVEPSPEKSIVRKSVLPVQPIQPEQQPAFTPVQQRRTDGTATVESIIAELTTEVKQEVITATPDPVARPTTRDPEPSIAELDQGVETQVAPLPKLFMPNTFTPNGDGVNDTYTVSMNGLRSMILRVYDMKSDRLVFSTNSGEPWAGTGCEDGVYLVAVEAITEDGRTLTEGKVVWLARSRMN